MFVPVRPEKTELKVKNSRFIAEIFPLKNQRDAREIHRQLKGQYPEAAHVVFAFAVGKNAETLSCSDDGEPAGTAGRPVLAVLKGKKCTNTLLTVTRYFGGTLLGTGGLVKAYGNAAKQVLSLCPFIQLEEKLQFECIVSYGAYEVLSRKLTGLGCIILKEDFANVITQRWEISAARADEAEILVRNGTGGGKLSFINNE